MITSFSNKKIQKLRNYYKSASARNKDGVFLVEGYRIYMEVPKEDLVQVFIGESFYNEKNSELDLSGLDYEILDDALFNRVADTNSPQGILAIVKRRDCSDYVNKIINGEIKENVSLLIAEHLQDPGNLGTIMRTASAAGISALIIDKASVDVYNPKCIRAGMGAIFRLPFIVVNDIITIVEMIQKNGINCYAAILGADKKYTDFDYRKNTAFVIGNEGSGLTDQVVSVIENSLTIPMHNNLESLNAGTAASILMYEMFRQRYL